MTQLVTGWHGKLPTVSDFAGRRLDPRFVELWDGAVSASLAALREAEGEHWVDIYLACPIWRFLLGAGALPAPFDGVAWTGVLMPSVDRVGRYYPLILAASLGDLPQDDAARLRAWRWLDALEDIAFGALEIDWTIDRLEAELSRIGLPSPDSAASDEGEHPLDIALSPAASTFMGFGILSTAEPKNVASCRWYSRNAAGAEMVLTEPGFGDAFGQVWTAHMERA